MKIDIPQEQCLPIRQQTLENMPKIQFSWKQSKILTSTSKLSNLKTLVGGVSSAMKRKISKFPRYHFTAHTLSLKSKTMCQQIEKTKSTGCFKKIVFMRYKFLQFKVINENLAIRLLHLLWRHVKFWENCWKNNVHSVLLSSSSTWHSCPSCSWMMLCLLAEQCWEHSLSGCSDHSDLKTWCKIKNSVSSTLSLNEDYLDICPDIDNWMLSIRRENESGKLYWVVPSTNNNRRSDNIKQQSCSFIFNNFVSDCEVQHNFH